MSTIRYIVKEGPEWRSYLPAVSVVLVFLVLFTSQRRATLESFEANDKKLKPSVRRSQVRQAALLWLQRWVFLFRGCRP